MDLHGLVLVRDDQSEHDLTYKEEHLGHYLRGCEGIWGWRQEWGGLTMGAMAAAAQAEAATMGAGGGGVSNSHVCYDEKSKM